MYFQPVLFRPESYGHGINLSVTLFSVKYRASLKHNPENAKSLRFWRVALWGTVAFLLFSVLFEYFFRVLVTDLMERRGSPPPVLPGPILPAITAAILVLLFAALSMVALWKFQLRREPAHLRCRFASYKRNAELCARLLLLVLLFGVGSSVSRTSRIYTCRCCLFTVQPACGQRNIKLSSDGFYDFDSHDGRHSGIYAKGKGSFEAGTSVSSDKFAYDQLQVDRTRFGWPLQAITRDVVRQQPEWHIAFEVWVPVNLVFWFLVWMGIHPIISLAKWLFRRLPAQAALSSAE
jgi:hypothetical protein